MRNRFFCAVALTVMLQCPVVRAVAMGELASEMPHQSDVRTYDLNDLELVGALQKLLPAFMQAYNVPGLNIALARHGNLVWEAAYGYADAHARRAMSVQTVFHSGSIAKAYAAIAIMQLVEQGLVKLDDPVSQYLTFEVKNPLGGPPVTIRHLLTHTSGIGKDEIASYLCDDPRTVGTLQGTVEKAFAGESGKSRWTAPVGAKWQYSNLGAATLGLIVERTNTEHLSYSGYVQKRIMDSLGMSNAQFPAAQTRELTRTNVWGRMSVGYQTMGGAWIPTAQVCFGSFPCGGSFAAPADYLRLLIALMNGGVIDGARLLKDESVAAMLTPIPEVRATWQAQQGLIWRLTDWNSSQRVFWHTGGHMFGWSTIAAAYPESGTAYVLGANAWSATRAPVFYDEKLFRFIGTLIQAAQAGSPRRPMEYVQDWIKEANAKPISSGAPKSIKASAWKLSYLRGLLFAESYQYSIATPQRVTETQARSIVRQTETSLSSRPALWDPSAFLIGIKDMTSIEPTATAIHDFAASPRMRITMNEAEQLYQLLDPTAASQASLAGLLTVRPDTPK
jgi:CubicO group peptidase (beta-lactamase class C family)